MPQTLRSAALALVALVVVALLPTTASAKPLRGDGTDAQGDAPSPSLDLVGATTSYDRKAGRLALTVTMAGDLDLTQPNQLVVSFYDRRCKKELFAAAIDLTDATTPYTYRLGKGTKSVYGSGFVDGATYTAKFRTKQIAGLKPAFFAIYAFPLDPKSKVTFDTTDCFPLG